MQDAVLELPADADLELIPSLEEQFQEVINVVNEMTPSNQSAPPQSENVSVGVVLLHEETASDETASQETGPSEVTASSEETASDETASSEDGGPETTQRPDSSDLVASLQAENTKLKEMLQRNLRQVQERDSAQKKLAMQQEAQCEDLRQSKA